MATDHILVLLVAERDKLSRAIEALQGSTKLDSKTVATAAPAAPVKRRLSAAGRRAIGAAAKKRWAAIKAAKAAETAPAVTPKAAPAKAPVAAKKKTSPARGAAYRKMMSEKMKAAWAKRKKAAVKKKSA